MRFTAARDVGGPAIKPLHLTPVGAHVHRFCNPMHEHMSHHTTRCIGRVLSIVSVPYSCSLAGLSNQMHNIFGHNGKGLASVTVCSICTTAFITLHYITHIMWRTCTAALMHICTHDAHCTWPWWCSILLAYIEDCHVEHCHVVHGHGAHFHGVIFMVSLDWGAHCANSLSHNAWFATMRGSSGALPAVTLTTLICTLRVPAPTATTDSYYAAAQLLRVSVHVWVRPVLINTVFLCNWCVTCITVCSFLPFPPP